MTIAQRIGQLNAERETTQAAKEFGQLVQFILTHRGRFSNACLAAEQNQLKDVGLTPRLINILKSSAGLHEISRNELRKKAAQNPHTLTDGVSEDASVIASGFVNSLYNASAFDTILPNAAQIPLRGGTVGAVSTGAVAFSIAEGSMKQMSRISLTGTQTSPLKVHVLMGITQELARVAVPQLIQNEMRNAVAVKTDVEFLAAVTSGLSPITSAGSTGESVRTDISNLLGAVTLGQNSKPYLITTSTIAKRWSMLTDQHGNSAFPELGPMGGVINQIPVLVSDGVTGGQVVLVDASGIGASGGEVALQQFDEASVCQTLII
jgi:hypothetical protein